MVGDALCGWPKEPHAKYTPERAARRIAEEIIDHHLTTRRAGNICAAWMELTGWTAKTLDE